MRHLMAGKKLNRNSHHRKSLVKNLIQELVMHETIETTETKAKLIIPKVEKIINKAKTQDVHSKRQIIAILFDDTIAKKITDDLAKRYEKIKNGYVKMLRLKRRRGDNTMIVRLQLQKIENQEKKDKKEEGVN
ncbi:50S ribosomal protein L17 [Candidatus Beckwithbacteria bacterium]|nr:50S ribosomal protein L17 [Candidatus Beckwithbacteria bacterium]